MAEIGLLGLFVGLLDFLKSLKWDMIKYKIWGVKVNKDKKIHKELLAQMVTLSTAGFGLVAALAWNEAVQSFVKEYVDPFLPGGSGVFSRFFYAILITGLAVLITYQLSRLSRET